MSYPVESERLQNLRDKLLALAASMRQLQCLIKNMLKVLAEIDRILK